MRSDLIDNALTKDIRRENRSRMLNLVREGECTSRAEIATATGLTKAAVSRITRELIEAGLLHEAEAIFKNGKAGRPLTELKLRSDGAYVLGVDIGANAQWILLTDIQGSVLARMKLTPASVKDSELVLNQIAAKANGLILKSRIDRKRLLGGGVAIAGVVDSTHTVLLDSPNLGWNNVPVVDLLKNHLNVPFRIDNRPNALLAAESRLGVAKDRSNVALILVSLGIGGALMIDDHIAHGRNNAAGQIGHLRMNNAREQCTCGRYGCLDTVASGHAILTRLKMIPQRKAPMSHGTKDPKLLLKAVKMAETGDIEAIRAFRAAGKQLGHALWSIAAVANPELIIIAGVVSQSKSYIDGVHEVFSREHNVPVEVATISNDTSAAWLALETYVFSRELDFERLCSACSKSPIR